MSVFFLKLENVTFIIQLKYSSTYSLSSDINFDVVNIFKLLFKLISFVCLNMFIDHTAL